MATSLDELIREMNGSAAPQRIQLAWEVLPALDGTLHAVDPDPDSYHFAELLEANLQYSVSLCGKTLIVRNAVVSDNELCGVCQEISGERQREFDAGVA